MMNIRIVIALLGCVLLVVGCGEEPKKKAAPSRLVKSVIVGQADGVVTRKFPGKVVANQKADLAFQVSGKLVEFPIKQGDEVKKGELLAKLDPKDFEHTLKQEQAQFDKAQKDLARADQLVEKGHLSKLDYDKVRENYTVTEARLDSAKKALADSSLNAPFDGTIATTFVNNFQQVQAKQKIASLQNFDNIDIEVEVPEQDLISRSRDDAKNNPATFLAAFPSLPGREFDVTLKEYETEADSFTQTYSITFTMPIPKDVNIMPGMTANLIAKIPSHSGAGRKIAIPSSSVATDSNGETYVWLIDPTTRRVSKQKVVIDKVVEDSVLLKSGLKDGQQVVAAGVSQVKEGMQVRTGEDGEK